MSHHTYIVESGYYLTFHVLIQNIMFIIYERVIVLELVQLTYA